MIAGPVTMPLWSRRDPIFDPASVIPLGVPFQSESPAWSGSTAHRPFGLRYATAPPHPVVVVDLSAVRYDPGRQVCVDPAGAPVFGRHTDGQTSTQTQTSDGHKSMDSDTDHRED